MQRKKGETYRVATGDAEKKSSNQVNSQLKANTHELMVQHKICSIMKTFTLQQALEVLERNFGKYVILKKWNTIRELCIVFKDGSGKKWELLSSGDDYFQHGEEYVIYEVE